jgi:hypothetical protein
MSLTYLEAVNEMSDIVKAAWDTTAWPTNLHYESVAKSRDFAEPTGDVWAGLKIRHIAGRQKALCGATGTNIFERTGNVVVMIKIRQGVGLQNFYNAGKVLADAFEGKSSPGGVWFRNVRINEIGRDGEYHQNNFIVDFEYDEVK